MKIETIEEKVEKYKIGDKIFTEYSKAEKYKLKLDKLNPEFNNHRKYFNEIKNFRNKLEKYIYDENFHRNHDYNVECDLMELNYCSTSDDGAPIFSFGKEVDERNGTYIEKSYFFVDEEDIDNITQEIYNEFLEFKSKVKVYKITRKEIKI